MKTREKLYIVSITTLSFIALTLAFYGLGRALLTLQYTNQKRILVDSLIEGVVIGSTFTTLIAFHLLARVWKRELMEGKVRKENELG